MDDDDEDEPRETSTVTHTITGGDYGAKGVTAADVVVTITDDDETPVISGSASPKFGEFEYDADAAAFDKTVATYTATDGDGDDITWSLSGDDSSLLSITENSEGKGILSFNDPPDFENPPSTAPINEYEVTVEASDGPNKDTLDVTVTVTNVNEAPMVTYHFTLRPPGEVEFAEGPYDAPLAGDFLIVNVFTATDPESDSVTWSVGGADAGHFSTGPVTGLDGYTQLGFKNSP